MGCQCSTPQKDESNLSILTESDDEPTALPEKKKISTGGLRVSDDSTVATSSTSRDERVSVEALDDLRSPLATTTHHRSPTEPPSEPPTTPATPTKTVTEKYQEKVAAEKKQREEQEKARKEAAKVLRHLEGRRTASMASMASKGLEEKRVIPPYEQLFRKGTATIRRQTTQDVGVSRLTSAGSAFTVESFPADSKRRSVTLDLEKLQLERAMSRPPPPAIVEDLPFEPKRPPEQFALDDTDLAHKDVLRKVFEDADIKKKGALEAKELGELREYIVDFTYCTQEVATKHLIEALKESETVKITPKTFIEIVEKFNVGKGGIDRAYAQAAIKSGEMKIRKPGSVGAVACREVLPGFAKAEFDRIGDVDDESLQSALDRVMIDADFDVTFDEFSDICGRFFKMLRTIATSKYLSERARQAA